MENLIISMLIGVGVYIAIYSLVDRVCKCIEHGHISKSFDEYNKLNVNNKKG